MSKRDYYDILGINKATSQADMKKAYRKLAIKYHPDKNPDNKASEDKFKEAAEAYEVLSNTEKRKKYDQFGHSGMQGGSDFHQYSDVGDIFESFGDVFGDLFGMGGRRRSQKKAGPTPQRGHDLSQSLEISFKDSYLGCKKDIKIYHYISCPKCYGSGCKTGTKPRSCVKCHGSGTVHFQQGFFTYQQSCPSCRGQGFTIASPCSACRGQSRIQKHDKLTISIPAGIFDQAELRVPGKGDSGVFGGKAGDLYLSIHIKTTDNFYRRDNDIVTTATLNYPQLVLGCLLEIENIDGSKVSVKIPLGCPVGKEIILPGKGFPILRGRGTGNLVIKTQCDIPTKLDADTKKFLKEFAKKLEQHNQKSGKGFSGFFKKFLG